MKVEKFGEGNPEVAVVYCVHGDEPCGKRAVERFKASSREIKKPFKAVLANEKAYNQGRRYVDRDLNSSMNVNDNSHESVLASRLREELQGLKVLDLHGTHSWPKPFAITVSDSEKALEQVNATGMDTVVDLSIVSGSVIGAVDGVAVECGRQRSDEAAENAYRVLLNFLGYHGVIDYDSKAASSDLYKVYEKQEGRGYRFTADNFSKVESGEVFAEKEGSKLTAEESFYPVLMSTNGYEDLVGFKAIKTQLESLK